MKKMLSKALVLLLALSMTLVSMGVWGATVTFEAEGKTVKTLEAVNGEVVMPDQPEAKEGQFIGWSGTLNGETFLLPPGAVLKGVGSDLTITAETLYFETATTASVRIVEGDLGLRFTSTLSVEDYERLLSIVGKESVKLGTYIMPVHYVTHAGGDPENSEAPLKINLENMAKYNVKYLDVPAKKFYTTDAANKTATIAGSVSNVLEKNRSLDFSACGYMKLTYTNGVTKTFYADYIYAETKHNLADQVFDAYHDRHIDYPNLIPDGTYGSYSTHSPYTMAELGLMKKLMDTVAYVIVEYKSPHYEYKSESDRSVHYDSPWLVDEFPDTNHNKNTVEIKPKEGHSIDELKAVCLSNRYRSMKYAAEFVNGTFRFSDNEWVSSK